MQSCVGRYLHGLDEWPSRCYQRQSERPTESGAGPRQRQAKCSRRLIARVAVPEGTSSGRALFFSALETILRVAAGCRYRRARRHIVADRLFRKAKAATLRHGAATGISLEISPCATFATPYSAHRSSATAQHDAGVTSIFLLALRGRERAARH